MLGVWWGGVRGRVVVLIGVRYGGRVGVRVGTRVKLEKISGVLVVVRGFIYLSTKQS